MKRSILIIGVLGGLAACDPPERGLNVDYRLHTIDSCEYIAPVGYGGFTHKANCSNPIHGKCSGKITTQDSVVAYFNRELKTLSSVKIHTRDATITAWRGAGSRFFKSDSANGMQNVSWSKVVNHE